MADRRRRLGGDLHPAVPAGPPRAPARRAALLGTGAGILFGLAAALTKAVCDELGDGASTSSPLAPLRADRGRLHLADFSQLALSTGALAPAAATSMGFDPIASVILGVTLLESGSPRRLSGSSSPCSRSSRRSPGSRSSPQPGSAPAEAARRLRGAQPADGRRRGARHLSQDTDPPHGGLVSSGPVRRLARMARSQSSFFCSSCGHESLAWSGRCGGCGEWNTLVEAPQSEPAKPRARGGPDRAAGGGRCRCATSRRPASPGCGPGSPSSTGFSAAAWSGLARPARRLAGDRQVDADRDGARQPRRRRPRRPLRLGRGVGRPGAAAGRAARRRALAVPALAETSLEAVMATLEAERPAACVIDSIQTMHAEGHERRPGLGRPGPRGRERGDGGGEADRLRGDPGRPRDQGRRGRRAAGARAPGRLRALLRGRARAQLPDGAGAQEPLRGDQRGGRVRDALRRSGRGRRPFGALRRRGERGRRARSCSARWRARGRCWSRSRRWSRRPRSCRRAGSRTGSTATGWRWCSRCSRATADRRWPAADVFVNVAGGVRVDEPAPTSRSRWRSPRRSAASRSPTSDGAPLACFGEIGLTGELRPVGHPDRRVAEARKFGLGPVIAPAAREPVGARAGADPARSARRRADAASAGAARAA